MSSQPQTAASASREALAGLKVLEISDSPGASFSCVLLADFNASVYVCESLPDGTALRRLGPKPWWRIAARNKNSIAVDTSKPNASGIVRKLLSWADLVITDVPQRGRAAHPWLRELSHAEREPLVVEVFPTGADRPEQWPWSTRGDMAAAVSGMMAMTGHANGTPVQPEFPMVEYLAGTLAALRAVAQLRRNGLDKTPSQAISVPLHQAVFRMIEWQMPIATVFGRPELRNGNQFPMNFSISNMHLTKDGSYITFSAANDAQALKLLDMVGGRELREDPRFSTWDARMSDLTELYKITEKWMAERTLAEVTEAALSHGVVTGPIFDARNIADSSHIKSRGNLVEVNSESGDSILMPGVVPRVEGWSAAVKSAGPALGAQTVEALHACGFSKEFIAQAKAEQLVV